MKKLYYGGPIRTMTDGEVPYAILTEDGIITALLSETEAEEITDAEPIDLKGHTLLPGFIDAHSHFSVSAEDALRAVTVNAAWQYGEEGRKGAIAPGMAADFVVLDCDPMAIPSMELRDLKICMTIKKDKIVYQA